MSYRVLMIEDDRQICEVVEDHFTAKGGLTLTVANDGERGLVLIRQRDYDIVLLDVMLPGIDGFSLCREIRADSVVPVIFITARAREEDVLYGYELGCDDYIVKPFSLAALYAKIFAVMKRAGGMYLTGELRCGEIRLNAMTLRVDVRGEEIVLPPKEFALLKYLIEHKNWVIDRETLLNKIWGYDYFGSDRVVDNHIKKLRKALGIAGAQIKTVISRGYKITD